MLSRIELNWELFRVIDADIKKNEIQSKDFQLRFRTANVAYRRGEINLKVTFEYGYKEVIWKFINMRA